MGRKDKQFFKSYPVVSEVLKQRPDFQRWLEKLSQENLLGVLEKYLSDATPETLMGFFLELDRVDFDQIRRHRTLLAQGEQRQLNPEEVEAVPLVTIEEQAERLETDTQLGLKSLQAGIWASVAFAGGAGTRFFSGLGELEKALPQPNEELRISKFDASLPKGAFPISPVGGLCFFEITIAEALASGFKTGRLPWVLFLTSESTDSKTRQLLQGRDLWGFPNDGWIAFKQAQEPRLDPDGDLIVVDDRGHLSWTGDGHGGVFRGLLSRYQQHASLVGFLEERGVRHLILHNIDNAAARPFSPSRLGFHLRAESLFTISAVRKLDPREKVGVLMRIKKSGKLEVVEYNVVDPAVANQRDAHTGRLVHEAGNINTNLIATKAVKGNIEPTIYTGKRIQSRKGQVLSSSMEMLSQHITRLIPPAKILAYEVNREEFFMPTKNMTGVDSVESTTSMLSNQSKKKLLSAGAAIDPSALCDLHPACGDSDQELAQLGIGPQWRLEAGTRLYLGLRLGKGAEGPVGNGSLTLEPGASLIIKGARPYGTIRLSPDRSVVFEKSEASCVEIGHGVVIKKGVRLVMSVGPRATLIIPSGRTISQNIEGELAAGTTQTL